MLYNEIIEFEGKTYTKEATKLAVKANFKGPSKHPGQIFNKRNDRSEK